MRIIELTNDLENFTRWHENSNNLLEDKRSPLEKVGLGYTSKQERYKTHDNPSSCCFVYGKSKHTTSKGLLIKKISSF